MTRISAPVGLDLGAVSAEEVALSIMAELVAVRHGREGGRLSARRRREDPLMATITMREIHRDEYPKDGGTAIQDDPARPVFHGNGPDDYACVTCGTILAEAMDPAYMTKKVRIRCATLPHGQRRRRAGAGQADLLSALGRTPFVRGNPCSGGDVHLIDASLFISE